MRPATQCATPASARNSPATGLARVQPSASDEAAAAMAALQREDRRERERDADRERQPADEQVRGRAGGERQRAPAGAFAEMPARDALEQHGRGDGGEHADDAHAQQRAERREEDEYAGVWWPPYQLALKSVKPSRSKRPAR